MKERIKSIDALRGLAILAVLLIHTTTRTLEASNFNIVGFSWTLFLNQTARFAVPLFLLISGFVLEHNAREESYLSFVKRRLSRIVIPYTLWSIFYYFIVYKNNHDNFFKVILTGNASYQLYFIPALIVFYLTFPLIHKLCQKIPNKYIFIFVFIIEALLLYKNYFLKAFDFGDHVNAMILGYSYFIIGVIVSKNKYFIDKIVTMFNKILPVLTIISGTYIFWEGRSRYLLTGNYLSYYSQWRPSVLIYTLLIALTFYYVFEMTKLRGSIVTKFSKHSFFVFFVHVSILELMWSLFAKNVFNLVGGNFVGRLFFDPIYFGITTVISFLIAYIIHKIPKTTRFFG